MAMIESRDALSERADAILAQTPVCRCGSARFVAGVYGAPVSRRYDGNSPIGSIEVLCLGSRPFSGLRRHDDILVGWRYL